MTTARALKFLSFTPDETAGGLWPSPNVAEWEEIKAALDADPSPIIDPTPDALTGRTLKALASYRGWLLYLEGCVKIHRFECDGINGFACSPRVGDVENVHVGRWIARVEFA
jgi:hypothetical protein